MHLDPVRRELVLKIVYYGPGLAGKTTNLKAVRAAAGEHASDLVSVEAHSERTLHCDWLNLAIGPIQNTNVRFALWTVPGQSYYAATRRAVLAGADGVVFVADSRREALDENIDSMNEMLGNLRHHGLPEDIPVVMQFNKQDLPTAVKREQLEPLMNVRGWPSFAAVANGGTGVVETATLICQLVAERVGTEPLPSTGLEQPQARDSGSFLISCHRCQTMLEVPSANPGEIYSCGVCNSTLEVVDGDRGVTRQPTGMPAAPEPSPRSVLALADDYAADQVAAYTPSGGSVALQPQATSAQPASESAFEIPGYTIVTTLDQTAQGRRYQVREAASGRTFRALSLSADLLRQPGYRDGLDPYVRLAGPIRHPNLLPLATMRTHGEHVVFISQDPADYEPLSYVLARRRALAPPHAMGLLRQMVLALEEGARHGAVHGWLRPDCILVGGDGNVLIDELCVPVHHRFLVKELAGASAATEYYLAPEHLQDDARSDIRSDMFVLGALLFRMMTGEGLVTGYNAHEALHKVNANGPRMLRDAAQGISRELNIFYQKLVAADRRERFQSYRELVEALDRFGGGAKRQNMQLTAPQGRAAATRSGARNPGAAVTRRVGGTSSLSGMASRSRAPAAPNSGQAPVRRRQDRDSGLGVVIVVVVVLVAGIAGFIAIQSNKAPVQPLTEERGAPPSNFPKPAVPLPTPAPRPDGPRPPTTSAATGGGVLPPPVQGPTPTPAPAPVPLASEAPEVTSAAERLAAQRTIADLLVQERFAEALVTAARLEDVQRVAKEADIEAMHRERKVAISALIEAGRPIEIIREALAPALTVWGMPGDDEWARAQVARAVQRLPEQQTTPVVGAVPAAGGKADVALTLTPVALDPAANALLQLEQALAANQPALAAQAVDAVPSANPEGKALRRMADLWAARIALVTRAVGPRKVKLRLPHPTTNEQWDVTGADNQGVAITAPNGSGTNLAWSQVPAKQQGKLFFEAASAAGTNPDECVIASVMQLVADEPGPALLLARKAKGAAPAEVLVDLDLLLSLHARRSLISALQRGQEGARSNNPKQVAEALTDIRRFDREAQAPFGPSIAELETIGGGTPTTAKPGEEPATKAGAVGLKERQNAVRALGWEPVGGAYLDPSGIIFATAANGQASGLTRSFPANTEGITLSIKGKGQLLILPGKAGQKTAGGVTIALPAEVTSYTVRFLGGILTITEAGTVLQSAQIAAQPTAITLMVIGEGLMPNAPITVGLQP